MTSVFINYDGSGPRSEIAYGCRKIQKRYLDGRSANVHAFRGKSPVRVLEIEQRIHTVRWHMRPPAAMQASAQWQDGITLKEERIMAAGQ